MGGHLAATEHTDCTVPHTKRYLSLQLMVAVSSTLIDRRHTAPPLCRSKELPTTYCQNGRAWNQQSAIGTMQIFTGESAISSIPNSENTASPVSVCVCTFGRERILERGRILDSPSLFDLTSQVGEEFFYFHLSAKIVDNGLATLCNTL